MGRVNCLSCRSKGAACASGGGEGTRELTPPACVSRQESLQQEAIPDSEVEFREQMIQEREGEIEQIEQGIVELNQIFKDIGTLVTEQQSFVGASSPLPASLDF